MLLALAALVVPVKEGDFVRRSRQNSRNSERIVHWWALCNAKDVGVGLCEESKQLNEHLAKNRFRRPCLDAVFTVENEVADLGCCRDLVRQVEGHHCGFRSQDGVAEDFRSGLRVYEYVKLCVGCDVADTFVAVDAAKRRAGEVVADRAAHDAQTLDMCCELGVFAKYGADVGKCASRDNPCCIGRLGFEGSGHGVDGRYVGGLHLRRGQQFGAVEAGLAVDVGGVEGRSFKGFAEADVQRDLVLLADCGEDRGGVSGDVLERGVAEDGGDA